MLEALGLENWQPPELLTYTRSASEAIAAESLDFKFFAPAPQEVQALLAKAERAVEVAIEEGEAEGMEFFKS